MKLNSLNGPKSTGNWVWFKETKFAVNILTKTIQTDFLRVYSFLKDTKILALRFISLKLKSVNYIYSIKNICKEDQFTGRQLECKFDIWDC